MEKIGENEIVKIATMYYEEGMTSIGNCPQKRGVKIFNLKMIVEQKRDGIVEIVINSSSVYTAKLERELEEKYQLKNAIVIDTFNLNKDEIKKIASQQAGLYLKKIAPQYKKIGLSWGNSLRGLVDSFPYTNHQEATILPLIGGLSDDYFDIQSNQLSYDLSTKDACKSLNISTHLACSLESFDSRRLSNNNAIQSILRGRKRS